MYRPEGRLALQHHCCVWHQHRCRPAEPKPHRLLRPDDTDRHHLPTASLGCGVASSVRYMCRYRASRCRRYRITDCGFRRQLRRSQQFCITSCVGHIVSIFASRDQPRLHMHKRAVVERNFCVVNAQGVLHSRRRLLQRVSVHVYTYMLASTAADAGCVRRVRHFLAVVGYTSSCHPILTVISTARNLIVPGPAATWRPRPSLKTHHWPKCSRPLIRQLLFALQQVSLCEIVVWWWMFGLRGGVCLVCKSVTALHFRVTFLRWSTSQLFRWRRWPWWWPLIETKCAIQHQKYSKTQRQTHTCQRSPTMQPSHMYT